MSIKQVKKSILQKFCINDLRDVEGNDELINITIDSRHVMKDCVFFALTGEFHDGHDFIADALDKKAGLIVANFAKMPSLTQFDQSRFLFVENTLESLWALARGHLQQFDLKKIAITGSNGKTTTKEMLKAALINNLGEEKVCANAGNMNNHFGVPLSALDVNKNHAVAIFEIGMNHPGELTSLCQIIEPTYGLITNIGPAHAGNFVDEFDGIQHAKGELFAALNHRGCVAINIDDERVVAEANKRTFKSSTTFGTSHSAQVKLGPTKPFDQDKNAQEVNFCLDGTKNISFFLPIAGRHHAKNAMAALAMVKELNLSVEEGCRGLEKMKPVKGRMMVVKSNQITIIDDSYNANPQSMTAGISTSQEFHAKRRIAVIGNMGELGEYSHKFHLALGEELAQSFEFLFVCGQAALPIVDGAKKSGMASEKISLVQDADQAIFALKNFVQPGDLIFIKGSSSNNMSKIASALN